MKTSTASEEYPPDSLRALIQSIQSLTVLGGGCSVRIIQFSWTCFRGQQCDEGTMTMTLQYNHHYKQKIQVNSATPLSYSMEETMWAAEISVNTTRA